MFKIVLLACFLNDPSACETVTMTGTGDIKLPFTCMHSGPLAFAE